MIAWEVEAESRALSPLECENFTSCRRTYFKAESQCSKSLRQKSRVKWVINGDENSWFFHLQKRNSIKRLNSNGHWIEDPAALKSEAYRYFQNQFKMSDSERPSFSSNRFKKLNADQRAALDVSFIEEEIKQGFWNCDDSKAWDLMGSPFPFSKPIGKH